MWQRNYTFDLMEIIVLQVSYNALTVHKAITPFKQLYIMVVSSRFLHEICKFQQQIKLPYKYIYIFNIHEYKIAGAYSFHCLSNHVRTRKVYSQLTLLFHIYLLPIFLLPSFSLLISLFLSFSFPDILSPSLTIYSFVQQR